MYSASNSATRHHGLEWQRSVLGAAAHCLRAKTCREQVGCQYTLCQILTILMTSFHERAASAAPAHRSSKCPLHPPPTAPRSHLYNASTTVVSRESNVLQMHARRLGWMLRQSTAASTHSRHTRRSNFPPSRPLLDRPECSAARSRAPTTADTAMCSRTTRDNCRLPSLHRSPTAAVYRT